jgi:hypothetical protein
MFQGDTITKLMVWEPSYLVPTNNNQPEEAVFMSNIQYTAEEMAEMIRDEINSSHNAPKTISLPCGYLHFWYANNRGNRYNTTIIRSSSALRATKSAGQTEVFAVVKCNFWRGIAFISKSNSEKLA